mmetsp:Transcript_20857/g.53803  ORF Transcript_20857/g.53803 Transcript_20857/m.53803 type:complete len:259 (-) Transcript_20857:227-1003(-)
MPPPVGMLCLFSRTPGCCVAGAPTRMRCTHVLLTDAASVLLPPTAPFITLLRWLSAPLLLLLLPPPPLALPAAAMDAMAVAGGASTPPPAAANGLRTRPMMLPSACRASDIAACATALPSSSTPALTSGVTTAPAGSTCTCLRVVLASTSSAISAPSVVQGVVLTTQATAVNSAASIMSPDVSRSALSVATSARRSALASRCAASATRSRRLSYDLSLQNLSARTTHVAKWSDACAASFAAVSRSRRPESTLAMRRPR